MTPLILALMDNPILRAALEGVQDRPVRFEQVSDIIPREVVSLVADLHPALIVAELNGPTPWLPLVRSDPATRRIPMIGIGAGEAAELLAAGVRIPLYMPDRLVENAAAILDENVREFEQAEALATQCDQPPPPLVLRGLREFNAGQYFECHETLEEAWNHEQGPVRDLYRVVLQVAIAYYQIERGNYSGARKMFLRSVQWFVPLPDRCQGIDVAALRADVAVLRTRLEALGPERMSELDHALLKPVRCMYL